MSDFSVFQKEFEKKKKDQGKIARLEADQVKEMLFAAFEKHQYYNIKDLRAKTQQPMVSCLPCILLAFISWKSQEALDGLLHLNCNIQICC